MMEPFIYLSYCALSCRDSCHDQEALGHSAELHIDGACLRQGSASVDLCPTMFMRIAIAGSKLNEDRQGSLVFLVSR